MRCYQRLLFVFNFSILYPILYNRFHVKDKFFIHVLNVVGSFRVGNIFRPWKICIHCCTMIKAFMWKNFRETLHGIYWVYVSMFKGKYTEHYFLSNVFETETFPQKTKIYGIQKTVCSSTVEWKRIMLKQNKTDIFLSMKAFRSVQRSNSVFIFL